MNVHDSGRLASGLLRTASYVDLASIPAAEAATHHLTSSSSTPVAVRENADNSKAL